MASTITILQPEALITYQDQYSEKLEKIFDVSHTQAHQNIIGEDGEFLILQKQGHIGSLDVVDRKSVERTMIIGKKNARETACSIRSNSKC